MLAPCTVYSAVHMITYLLQWIALIDYLSQSLDRKETWNTFFGVPFWFLYNSRRSLFLPLKSSWRSFVWLWIHFINGNFNYLRSRISRNEGLSVPLEISYSLSPEKSQEEVYRWDKATTYFWHWQSKNEYLGTDIIPALQPKGL